MGNSPQVSPGATPRIITVNHLVTIFAWTLAFVLFFRFFASFKIVVLGFLAAACLACTLKPLMRKTPGPRGVKAMVWGTVPLLLLIGLVTLTVWQLAAPIKAQLAHWPKIVQQINGLLAAWSQRFGLEQPMTVNDITSQLGEFVAGAGGAQVVTKTTSILSGIFIALAFIFIGAIYLLADPADQLISPLMRMLPAAQRPRFKASLLALGPRLRWWLLGTLIGSVTIGLAAWLGYSLIGLEFAIPLALFAGIGEMVPTIGPIVTLVVALLFAMTQGTFQVIGVFVIYCIIQGLESYVLIPKIMEKAVKVPPVVTLFTLVFWGTLFGLPGLLLAIPLDLVIWSFAEHFLIDEHEDAETATAGSRGP